MTTRRSFLLGLAATVAAPAIVRPGLLMPVKQMLDTRPAWLPDGFMLPEGQLLSRATYKELFSVIGTAYGGGPTTFRLPDFSGRIADFGTAALQAGSFRYVIRSEGRDYYPVGEILPLLVQRS